MFPYVDGMKVVNASGHFFDTLTVDAGSPEVASKIHAEAAKRGFNLRPANEHTVGVTFDESVTEEELAGVASCFLAAGGKGPIDVQDLTSFVKSAPKDPQGEAPAHAPASASSSLLSSLPSTLHRSSPILTHPVFNTHHSETELMRYIHSLQEKDLSLVHAMVPLGSCTMKLNASAAMRALTWPAFGGVHPFVDPKQVEGWKIVVDVRIFCRIPSPSLSVPPPASFGPVILNQTNSYSNRNLKRISARLRALQPARSSPIQARQASTRV